MKRNLAILTAVGGMVLAGTASAQLIERRTFEVLVASGGGSASSQDGVLVGSVQEEASPCPTKYGALRKQHGIVVGAANLRGGRMSDMYTFPLGTLLPETPGTRFCVCNVAAADCSSADGTQFYDKVTVAIQSSPTEVVDCWPAGGDGIPECQ